MILRALTFLLLLYGTAHAQLIPFQQVPSGTFDTTPPPQAAAQGFTTPIRLDDFSQSFDIDCEGSGNETQQHEWYLGWQGNMFQSSCAALIWPYIDKDGSTVLKITNHVDNRGGIESRVGISSLSYYLDHGTLMPINLYVEMTTRATPMDTLGSWIDDWGGTTSGIEWDLNEFHSGDPSQYGSPFALLWHWANVPAGCAGGDVCAWLDNNNILSILPNWRPDQYHKYGLLMYQADATHMNFCEYVDDIKLGCQAGNTILSSQDLKSSSDWTIQATTGEGGCCEGSWTGINMAIDQVVQAATHTDPSGRNLQGTIAIHVVPDANNTDYGENWASNYGIRVTGTGTNADGFWSWDKNFCHYPPGPDYPCNDGWVYLYGPRSIGPTSDQNANPATLTGSYSGTGGKMNPYANAFESIDGFSNMVKSVRIFSCANWQTTQCSVFNNNGPPQANPQ